MSNETIFREVDEELRGDRMRTFWRNFGPYIIGAAVLVVLAVAANEAWRWWQSSNASRSADQFYAALEAAETNYHAAAQQGLEQVIASGSGGYPTLARFRSASLLAQQGDTAGAIAAYDALAASENNQQLRELALVFAANLLVDTGDVPAVQQRVGGLVDPNHPMRNAAREAIGLAQYRAGDLNAALATLNEIASDPLVSSEQQQRVRIYVAQLVALGALTPEQQAAAAAAPATAPEPATTEVPAAATPNEPGPAATTPDAAAPPVSQPPAAMQPAPDGAAPATGMQAPPSALEPAPVAEPVVEPATAAPLPAMQPAPEGAAPASSMQVPVVSTAPAPGAAGESAPESSVPTPADPEQPAEPPLGIMSPGVSAPSASPPTTSGQPPTTSPAQPSSPVETTPALPMAPATQPAGG